MPKYEVALSEACFPAQADREVREITVGGLLREIAAPRAEAEALVEVRQSGEIGRRWTYGALLAKSERLALALASRFRPGERVVVWSPNSPEWVLMEYACALAGLVLVTANPAYQVRELRYVPEQSGTVAFFLVDEYRGNSMAEIGAGAVAGLGAVREVCDMNDAAALHAVASSATEQALPDVSPGCCLAYRLDADRHSNVLIRFDSEGSNDHAEQHAKGLEWPFVVPVNTMTRVRKTETAITDRASGRFYCSVLGVEPSGYAAARDDEGAELDRERVRLWYVAATRARELLVLPRLDVDAASTAWLSLVDLALPDLTTLDLDRHVAVVGATDTGADNEQSRAVFAAEAAVIAERQRSIVWRVPSRDEGAVGPAVREEVPAILVTDGDGAPAESEATATIRGGRERGIVLHKIIEEVLTGETAETMPAMVTRAEDLIRALGRHVADDPALGLAPAELAGCVIRALALPEVAALRPGLLPEFPLYASTLTEAHEEVTTGIADAIAFGPDGVAQVVIDWKSDVDLAPEMLEHYRAQMRAYLDATSAECGLIVAVTSGTVVSVT